MGMGHKTDSHHDEIPGYLLGQLGKNYSDAAKNAKAISGKDLLSLAYERIKAAYLLSGGRILFLECENDPKLLSFYTDNGFRQLPDYESANGLCLFVKELTKI